ncbi:hypothetical protein GCM10010435_70460 [Winogradskya consettensis]|uniref:Chitin-binding type-4 domain-containing protein n=1 Tax=Winogradskya consettensis TaxID=113560 RepID=A0A919SQ47_9ACTN|nr:lytic polysaccharide monooxygenase [Actinoplanes consettensis]GIM75497.1 hypothetical protein Aco04nite_45650 [Actinoplanes consettensis]
MKSARSLAAIAAAGGVVAVTALLPAVPALAHGAPTTPISRTAACAPNGEEPGAAACKAAAKANGANIGSFDNLRIANVNGKDKSVVPDGHLCSGGLPNYKGLDLARDDWPSTKVTAGATLAVKYQGTIPHKGSFRLYLTKQGYDPTKALTWDDLTSSPVATFKDPTFSDGSYRMSVKIPKDRSGAQLLYVVWETSSTPDTYYSCSDLVVKAKPAAVVATSRTPTPSPSPSKKKATASPSAAPAKLTGRTTAPSATTAPAPQLNPVAADSVDDGRAQLGHLIIAGALLAIALAGAAALTTRLRSR